MTRRMKTLLWQHLPCDDGQAARAAAALSCTRRWRGCCACAASPTPSRRTRFLNPSLDQLHDPFKLADMDRAVARLEQALARKERIAIHGDYDVDGITSTVILRRALELLGGDVVHFIPERLQGRLRAAARGDRSAARRRRVADRLGRLRHPRRRRGAARARARRRSDHHRPSRAGRRRCRRRSR